MEPVTGFLIGLAVLISLTAGALASVHEPLCAILQELCGAEHRARFWARLYDASLLLLVFFFSMWSPPGPRSEHVEFFDYLGMFRAGVFGLLLGLGVLAFFMLVFIARHDRELAREARRTREPAEGRG